MSAPINFDIHLVKELSDHEKEEICALYQAAFKDDAFHKAVTNGSETYEKAFFHSCIIAGLRGGEVYLAREGTGDTIVGAAIWFPPGCGLMATHDQGVGGFDDLFAAFPPEHLKWWLEYFLPKYEQQTTAALGEGVKMGAWHLLEIAVRPDVQRQGIGKALIEFVEQKAAKDGKMLCLETEEEQTIEFYKKVGFKVVGQPELYFSPASDFPMWVLTKETVEA